jgi:hypothetical protein
MKRIYIGVGLIVLLIAGIVLVSRNEKSKTNVLPVTDSRNATYIIEGTAVTLIDGRAEQNTVPGSASKTVTQYFGNEAIGDVNGDGVPDTAFILTQTSGGSGTFYYVVVALKMEKGYQGTNAVLLGDRIAPQTTEITNGRIIVNYADRSPKQSMSTAPSVGVSKYLRVDGMTLSEVPIITSDAYPLYAGASWNTSTKKTSMVGSASITGASIDSVPVTNTMDPSSIFSPFETYYASKLKNAGWSIDTSLAAGGHTGGQTGYRKGSNVLLTEFHVNYHSVPKDAPSECPCDVTLSLFSGSSI